MCNKFSVLSYTHIFPPLPSVFCFSVLKSVPKKEIMRVQSEENKDIFCDLIDITVYMYLSLLYSGENDV